MLHPNQVFHLSIAVNDFSTDIIVLCVCVCAYYRADSAEREGPFIGASSRAGPDGVPAAQVLHPAVSIWRDRQTHGPPTGPSPPPASWLTAITGC